MVALPQIQIRLEHVKIGLDADPGVQSIRQPKAMVEMKSPSAKLDMKSPPGELKIDQSRAWDALGVGSNLETMNRIYTEARNVALQGIARIVENGNRLADISSGSNAIAEIARQLQFDFFEFNYTGEASYDNVDIDYRARKPEINASSSEVELDVRINRPEIGYERGKLDVYMRQYPSVVITSPQIDFKA